MRMQGSISSSSTFATFSEGISSTTVGCETCAVLVTFIHERNAKYFISFSVRVFFFFSKAQKLQIWNAVFSFHFNDKFPNQAQKESEEKSAPIVNNLVPHFKQKIADGSNIARFAISDAESYPIKFQVHFFDEPFDCVFFLFAERPAHHSLQNTIVCKIINYNISYVNI